VKSKPELVADQIAQTIMGGAVAGKLPSEQEIARQYHTSPVTAAKALNLLRERGLVTRVPRVGTFAKWVGRRKVRIYCRAPEPSFANAFEPLLAAVSNLFPQLDLEYETKAPTVAAAVEAGCELFIQTTLYPRAYSEFFAPLSVDLGQRFAESPDYQRDCFAIHRDHHLTYGVPFTFSPIVWRGNLDLLGQFQPLRSVYDLTFEDVQGLSRSLAKRTDIALFDREFVGANLMNLIYSHIPDRESAATASRENVKAGLDGFKSWYPKAFDKQYSFRHGNTLFSCTCRQNLNHSGAGKLPFRNDVLPVPERNGSRVASVASCSLFVSNCTSDARLMFEICEAFLAPAAQKIIAETRYGIPVLKSLQLDRMDSSEYRDDVFFTEARNMVPPNRFFDKDFVAQVYALLDRLASAPDELRKFPGKVLALFDFYQAREAQREVDVSKVDS